jgi:hypothetical protein
MNDDNDHLDDGTAADPSDDELASAYVDGELDDPAVVESNPLLRQRADDLRAVGEQLRAPTERLGDDERDQLLTAALEHGTTPVATVRRIWLPRPAAAAAAVLLVAALGIGLIISGVSHHSSPARFDAASATATSAPSGPKTTIPDLGQFSDQAALRTAVVPLTNAFQRATGSNEVAAPAAGAGAATGGTFVSSGAAGSTTTVDLPAPTTATHGTGDAGKTVKTAIAALERCDEVIQATDSTLGPRTAVAEAHLGNRLVLVYSNPISPASAGAAPQTRITVTDEQSCAVLFAFDKD